MAQTGFILSCDSPADLTAEYYARRDISYIGYPYNLGGADYIDDLGAAVPYKKLFDDMANGASTRTAQPNAEDYTAYFRSLLSRGQDVLHVCLSSGLTGAMTSANIAKHALSEEFPRQRIFLVDSLGASRVRTLFTHVIPNALGPVIVVGTISLGIFIVTEATLSYLGIGLPSTAVSWGRVRCAMRPSSLESSSSSKKLMSSEAPRSSARAEMRVVMAWGCKASCRRNTSCFWRKRLGQ